MHDTQSYLWATDVVSLVNLACYPRYVKRGTCRGIRWCWRRTRLIRFGQHPIGMFPIHSATSVVWRKLSVNCIGTIQTFLWFVNSKNWFSTSIYRFPLVNLFAWAVSSRNWIFKYFFSCGDFFHITLKLSYSTAGEDAWKEMKVSCKKTRKKPTMNVETPVEYSHHPDSAPKPITGDKVNILFVLSRNTCMWSKSFCFYGVSTCS